MNVDSQGVRRGLCSRCDCKEFATNHVKCRCGHPPTAHVDLSTGSASGIFAHHGKDITDAVGSYSGVNNISGGYRRQSSRQFQSQFNQQDPRQRSCHNCSSMYSADIGACPICYQRDNCPCGNMKFYDPLYDEAFPYCSPSCRDNYLLPEYNRKLQEYLSNPLHVNGSVGFSNTAHTSAHATSAIIASTQGTSGTSVVTELKQSTICIMLPKIRPCVRFYKNVWSEGDKYGLYVTGLMLGEDTTLRLADLIYGTAADFFNVKTSHSDMMLKYNIVPYGRIFRKFDFELICKKAQEIARKCDAGRNIAFFLHNTQVSGMGLQTKDQHVTILHVDGGSIAELSGICSGDIIQSIGLVNQDQMDKFEFKDVTKQKHVTSVLNTQSPTVIGSVLIIERFKMSYV